MATIKLRKGQNPVSFLGANAVSFASLSWINATNVKEIQAVSTNGAGYTKFTPGSSFGPQSFVPVTDGTIAGYVIVTKVAIDVDAALFITATATTEPPSQQPGVANVVLISGQSNSQTLAGRSALWTGPFSGVTPSYTRQYQRAKVWNPATSAVELLQVGSTNYSLTGAGIAGNAQGAVHPDLTAQYEDGFSYMIPLAQQFELQNSSGEIYFFQHSRGNTPIGQFMPGAQLYGEILTDWNNFKAALQAQGKTINVIGMLFKQGEADATGQNSNYAANMATVAAGFRQDMIGAGKKIIIDTVMHESFITPQQRAWVASDSNAAIIDTSLATRLNDSLHLDAPSVLKLGMQDNYNALFGTNVTYTPPANVAGGRYGFLFFGKSYAAGNTNGRWKDLSGRASVAYGFDMYNNDDASTQFQLVTGLNGKLAYRSTGAARFTIAPLANSDPFPFTITAAVYVNSDAGSAGLAQFGNSYLFAGQGDGQVNDGTGARGGQVFGANGALKIFTIGWTNLTGQAYMRLNGQQVWTGELALAPWPFGTFGVAGNTALKGDVYAFMVRVGLATQVEARNLEQEIATDLGVTLLAENGGTTTPPATTTPTVTISNVTVSGQTVTITASSSDNSTIQYSLDGTTYQASNVFSNVPAGSYSNISAKIAGNPTPYKYPSTVTVTAATTTPPANSYTNYAFYGDAEDSGTSATGWRNRNTANSNGTLNGTVTYTTGSNGKKCFQITNAGGYFTLPSLGQGVSQAVIGVVVEPTSTDAKQGIFGTTGTLEFIGTGNEGVYAGSGFAGDTNLGAGVNIFFFVFNLGGDSYIRRNGRKSTSFTFDTAGDFTNAVLGTFEAGNTTFPLSGKIYASFIRAGLPTEAQFIALEDDLYFNRFGITRPS